MSIPQQRLRRLVTATVTGVTTVASVLAGAGATPTSPERVPAGSPSAASSADTRTTTFATGSRGLGDPYFPFLGNGGYDVDHYDLDLAYDPEARHLDATATITATATEDLGRFDLDLSGLSVSSVEVDDAPAGFDRVRQELVVTPGEGLPRGRTFVVRVRYAGTPRTVTGSPVVFGADYGWIYTADGAFVGCEPNAAHTWYPANDHPTDKATFRFHVRVPNDRRAVANGRYLGRRTSGSTTTYEFAERQPMATYLATVDIGRWRFHQGTTPRGVPSLHAVDPTLAAKFRRAHTARLTGRVTDYWTRVFGRYPFDSTGGIVDDVPDIGFSLETQTRPIYGFVPDPTTLSHELAHEWFGDSVSVRSWRHIWLNEGFATFAQWLWAEHTGGATTLRAARRSYRELPRGDSFWHQRVADPKRDGMFSAAVYYRGAMTLAALRERIGDRDFFRLLRTWARVHRHGNATTAQFTRLAERVSGRSLDRFFDVWLRTPRRPPLP